MFLQKEGGELFDQQDTSVDQNHHEWARSTLFNAARATSGPFSCFIHGLSLTFSTKETQTGIKIEWLNTSKERFREILRMWTLSVQAMVQDSS